MVFTNLRRLGLSLALCSLVTQGLHWARSPHRAQRRLKKASSRSIPIGEEIHKLVVEFLGMSPEVKGKLQSALKGGKK